MKKCMVPSCSESPTNTDGFLCRSHWFRVPAPLRSRIWSLFRKKPGSREHLEAISEAVTAASSDPASR